MTFQFPEWSTAFSPAFHESAKAMLENALNKGNKPPVIQGRIDVVELSMGTQPPTLTLLEIGDLSLDRFRGILRLGYQGDAWIEVRCRVQANPLSHNPNLLPSSTLPLSTPLLALQPLLVPMTLRLSRLHLRAILILVVSASKGITLVFKNDPLQNVDVSSTFDSVEVIRGYLQQEIEGQLREMFREDLPGIIHRLSQRWFTGSGVGGKVEMPYRDPDYAPSTVGTTSRADDSDDEDSSDVFSQKDIFPRPVAATPLNITPQKRATQRPSRKSLTAESPTSYTIFPGIEEYDPTYGLRPEGVPTHSGYEAFGRLWEKAREGEGKGFGGLMSATGQSQSVDDRGDVSDVDWDEEQEELQSFDLVEVDAALQSVAQDDLRRSSDRRSTVTSTDEVEWETFPAVGGGVITRPRVYHSQSQIRAPSEVGGLAIQSPGGTGGSVTARASSIGGASSTIGSSRHRAPPPPFTAYPQEQRQRPPSLRRFATARPDLFSPSAQSDPFLAPPSTAASTSYRPRPTPTSSSSAARTSGSSWDTGDRTRTSTLATSQLPSEKSAPGLSLSPNVSPQFNRFVRPASIAGTSPGRSFAQRHPGPGGITLPLNNTVSQLATLSHSAQTLSPYARGHEHIAVRSFPHLGKSGLSTGSGSSSSLAGTADSGSQVKARRKRIFHLRKKDPDTPISPDVDISSPLSMTSSIFDDSSPEKSAVSDHPGDAWRSASLTGMAARVMSGGQSEILSARPNLYRAPDSRSSYGFPRRVR